MSFLVDVTGFPRTSSLTEARGSFYALLKERQLGSKIRIQLMSKSKFYDLIKDVIDERGVETPYKNGLCLYFPNTDYTYPFQCDGYMEPVVDGRKFRLIIEYKLDELLNEKSGKAKVLIQVVWYLKMFELDGKIVPNVCLVGDKNECFALHTNPLLKYLDEDVNWDSAPSKAYANYPEMVAKIANDADINPFVFIVDENFSFKAVAEKIQDLAYNVQRYVRVTEHNISNIFDYFCKNVLKRKNNLNGHDTVGVFMGVLNDSTNYYQHPANPNILVCNGKNVNMDGSNFKSFFGYFDRNYTPQEKTRMTAIADRLIEDFDRRMKGDFWTPTLFVDYAHNMLERMLGSDWRDRFVVWDNCWGSGNLTRDYHFSELYCSTLFQSELDMGASYNPEATKFQFDFLNDYIPAPADLVQYNSKLPQGLHTALQQNKPMLFLLNPPYGMAANGFAASNSSKEGIAKTKINKLMLNEKMGACSQNLYAQFLYRILRIKEVFGLTNCYIGLYSPSLFMTGPSWKAFRKRFLTDFAFVNACQFQASHFSDVSDSWGISFTIWKSGECIDKENFRHELIDDVGGEINVVGEKNVYNIDSLNSAMNWAKTKQKNAKSRDCITAKSALNISNTIKPVYCDVAFFVNDRNNVDANASDVYLMTMPVSRHVSTLDINIDNFARCTALFAARKLIEKNWVNSKDEYLAPNELHPSFQEYQNDSIVFSIFHSASNQSSLRQVEFEGKRWNVYNEFFWMSKDEILQLASENHFDECYNDARTSNERYIYRKLQDIALSTEAQAVLNKANEIVRSTFKFRELFNGSNPEYQIMNWDCGWYQIKALAKEYGKNNLDEFNKLFKALADKMRPMVYTLGFLK